ncbi:MAG: enoyl-CoA hydratase/isomerase family protein [Deltaproteobacteria bacterium]|nr:enoyl-CoA hydratase/isomerase family protein [Deltaproteobacteria bacterium]
MSLVLFQQEGPIGRIIFNNPVQLNAMTPEMADDLLPVIDQINSKPEIRVVIISGSGRAFSAGGNLQFILDHQNQTPEQNKKEMIEFYSKFLSLRKIEVPTIAMIHGSAMGAGLCIAMICDLRYAADNAKMGVNFAKLGLSSGMGTLYSLSRLLGPTQSADLLLTGRTLPASEALQMGLLNNIFPADILENKVLEIAQQISQNAPIPLKIMKKGLQKASQMSLEEIFDYESEGQAITFATDDLKEGVKSIQEKRAPKFIGK